MPGGLIQLNAIGKEDIYLTINPQISYFKNVYRKYSNFSKITFNMNLEHIDNSESLYDRGIIGTFKIPKNGDLIKDFYVKVSLPGLYCDFQLLYDVKWTDDVQYKIIDYIEFSAGGRTIQRFDSEYLYIYYKTHNNDIQLENLSKCLNDNKFQKDNLDLENYIGNYNSNNKTYISTNYTSTFTNKYYDNGFFKQPIDIVIPIPVWFSDEPFPIYGLQYMDINVKISLKPLKELVLIRKKELSGNFQTKSNFVPPRNDLFNALIDNFLQAKSVFLYDIDRNYNADIYTIPPDSIKIPSTIPEYNDFNLNGWYGVSPESSSRLISSFIYTKTIPNFIDNYNKIFRKAKISVDINKTSYKFENIVLSDSGIGYYVPPPYRVEIDENTGEQYKSVFFDGYTNTTRIDTFIFSRTKILSIQNNSELVTLLLSIFPKLSVIDSKGRFFEDVLQVDEISILGEIKSISFINNSIDPDFFENTTNTYNVNIYDLITESLTVEFNLLAIKEYDYDDTIYRNAVTNNTFNTNDKFAPLVDIKIKNKGQYYIGSPDIYLYGKEANFDPTIYYIYEYGNKKISRVDVDSKTPLGFLYKPIIKYYTKTPNSVKLDPSLGIYTVWWYPFGLFRGTNDKYTDDELPDKTYLDFDPNGNILYDNYVPKNTNPYIYRDKQFGIDIPITKLGKPIIKIEDATGNGTGVNIDVIVTDGGVSTFEIVDSESGFKSGKNISIDYNNSFTNGSFLTFRDILISNGRIVSINIGNKGKNFKVGDLIRIIDNNLNKATIKVNSIDNGTVSDVVILDSGRNYSNNVTYKLHNENDGSGALFKVKLRESINLGIVSYVIDDIEIISSGKNYIKYNPEIIIVNNEYDYNGFGAKMSIEILDGQITNIFPVTYDDRGYNYELIPYVGILGPNAFIAVVTHYDSNGGIKNIKVTESFLWPKEVIEKEYEKGLFNNVEVYSDENLYSSDGYKILDDFKVQYYLEVLIKGTGKGARIAIKFDDLELVNNTHYKIKTVSIINPGKNYDRFIINVIDKFIQNSNAIGAKFNLSIDTYGSIDATIVDSGFNYMIGDKFRIVGGKFKDVEDDNTAYIEVINTNNEGGIISIKITPGLGYYNKTIVGIRDNYYFFPRPVLGINRINIIEQGSFLKDSPDILIEDPISYSVERIDKDDYSIILSKQSAVGYLETELLDSSRFNLSNIDNFMVIQPFGVDIKLNYYKSLLSQYTIESSGINYSVGDIVKLYINHDFQGLKIEEFEDGKFIIGRFKITSVSYQGSVESVEPIIENPLDFSTKYIELYYKYHLNNSSNDLSNTVFNVENRLLFSYGNVTKLVLDNDNQEPEFYLNIDENYNLKDTLIKNKGRNLTTSPVYNINSNYLVNPTEPYRIPIIGIFNKDENNISDLIVYIGKNYTVDPTIEILNLYQNKPVNTGYLYTEQIELLSGFLTEKYVYKFNPVSGNGYRHLLGTIVPNPNESSSNVRKAILETKSLGKLEYVEVVLGGSNFESEDDFIWNSSDYNNNIVIKPLLYNGSIQSIIVLHSSTIFDKDVVINIEHKRGLSSPIIVNSIMNYHLHKINVIDPGVGYSSNIFNDLGQEVILIEYDPPCPDKYTLQGADYFYAAKAMAIIENCGISKVYPLSGNFEYTTDNKIIPNSSDYKIQVNVTNSDTNNPDLISEDSIEASLKWIRIQNVWYIYDFSITIALDKNRVKNLPTGLVQNKVFTDVDNIDGLFTFGKKLDIKLYESNDLIAVDVDRSVFNQGFEVNQDVYIIDQNKYNSILNNYNLTGISTIDLYDYPQLLELELIIARCKILKVETGTLFNVNFISQYNYRMYNIINSLSDYESSKNLDDLKIYIKQGNDDIGIIYPFFGNVDYYNTDWSSNSEIQKPINEIIIMNSSDNFEYSGVIGYRGGGLFQSNIIMEAGISRFASNGYEYDKSKKPIYNIAPAYYIDKYNFYKNKFLETYQEFETNLGDIDGDVNFNIRLDGGEYGGIKNFQDYYNREIGRTYNDITKKYTINNDYSSELIMNFIASINSCDNSDQSIYTVSFVDNNRGYYYFSKPIILPNNSYVENIDLNINLQPYTPLLSEDDYKLVFGGIINNYNLSFISDYIFLEDIELKKYLIYEQKYFITQQNRNEYININNDTEIDYNTFGSSKDILIFARRSDVEERNDILNFTKLDSKYQVKNFSKYNSYYYTQYSIYRFNNPTIATSDLVNETTRPSIINTLSKFVNQLPNTFTIIDSVTIQDLYPAIYNKSKYISYENGLTISELRDIREYWDMRDLDKIPIITYNNESEFTPDIIENIELKFNNMTREENKSKEYYTDIQTYNYYNGNIPGLYVYSFSKDPIKNYPSGTCNFSHLNKVSIKLKINPKSTNDPISNYTYNVVIYNRYYNVLTFKSGILELMFFK